MQIVHFVYGPGMMHTDISLIITVIVILIIIMMNISVLTHDLIALLTKQIALGCTVINLLAFMKCLMSVMLYEWT